MPSDITAEARKAAMKVLARLAEKSIGAAFENLAQPILVGKAVAQEAGLAITALLAAGWRPAPHPDAISAAEARGRREGIEEAAKECDRIAGNALDFQREYRRAAGHCAFVVRALSSIPPHEAPK